MVWEHLCSCLPPACIITGFPLEDHLGLTVEPSAAEELHELAGEIVRQVNRTLPLPEGRPKKHDSEHTFSGYRKDIMKAYDSLAVTTGLKVGIIHPPSRSWLRGVCRMLL